MSNLRNFATRATGVWECGPGHAVKCLSNLHCLPYGGFSADGNNPFCFIPGWLSGSTAVFVQSVRQMPQMELRGRRFIRTSIASVSHLFCPPRSNHPNVFSRYRSSDGLCARGFAETSPADCNTSDRSNPLAWTSSDVLGSPHPASKGTTK